MADKIYDGVVEAVHYRPDGQVDWVRAYLRRGAIWSDRVIIKRDDLIKEIKAGKKMMAGQRVQYMAGTFEVTVPIQTETRKNQEILITSPANSDKDHLDGVPIL